jgi:sugar lactone lactonase YvrE
VALGTLACNRLQAQQKSTSLIETIVGANSPDVVGSEFSLGTVGSLVTDAVGNLYFSQPSLGQVFRAGRDEHVTAYAGNGVRSKHLEGVLAVASPLSNPMALAVDAAGNLLIADGGFLLRIDAASGVVSTVFKMPYRPAGSVDSIKSINGMAVGPDGVLYIADAVDQRVKSYSLGSEAISILAGNGTRGATHLDVPATESPLQYPQAVAVAPDGTIYFSTMEPAVFRIRPEKSNLEALDLRLEKEPPLGAYDIPRHIVLDAVGHLFVAQPNRSRVLRVDLKSGKVAAYAGTGSQNFNGDGISAVAAKVTVPDQLAVDSLGNLIVAELFRIRRVNAMTHTITTVVGNGLPATSATARTPALQAKLWEPAYVVPAPDGSVYITSSFSNRLLHVDPRGYVNTAAGGGNPIYGERPALAFQVSLNYPQGIWLDDNGDVYFSDYTNRIVRRLSPVTGAVTNFATTPRSTNSGSAFLLFAGGLIADANHFYLSDPDSHLVWRISRWDGTVEPYAGTGSGAPEAESGDGGDAKSVTLLSPCGLALDSFGNLFIADGGYPESRLGRILRVDADSGRATVVLSNLDHPSGLAFQSANVLCYAEAGRNQVGCMDLISHKTRVVAGIGVAGFAGDGSPAECAQLNRPYGISFDRLGNLYITDTGNQRIRRVRLANSVAQCQDH